MKSIGFKAKESGQTALVVLLIMAVLLTIGIGVASDSTVEQATTRQELESMEAFNAADETIEWALGQDLTSLGAAPGVTDFTGTVSLDSDASPTYTRTIRVGESGQLDVTGDSLMTITWPAIDPCNDPAIIVTLLSLTGIQRYAYGPVCVTRVDGFIAPTVSGGMYQVNQNILVGYTMARIKAVYGSVDVTVTGLSTDQLYTVTAQAERDTGETRSVQASKGLPAVPSIFDYTLFNGSGDIVVTGP
jgi:type II secretory pathway pseudopilin PulG